MISTYVPKGYITVLGQINTDGITFASTLDGWSVMHRIETDKGAVMFDWTDNKSRPIDVDDNSEWLAHAHREYVRGYFETLDSLVT